jgi:hypothetical protein
LTSKEDTWQAIASFLVVLEQTLKVMREHLAEEEGMRSGGR